MERLTADLAARAAAHIQEVEGLGGMAKAIEAGVPKMRIEQAAARTQARIDSGRQTVVGINKHRLAEEAVVDVLKVDNRAVREAQIAKIATLKADRDEPALAKALNALSQAAATGGGNLLELSVEAARAKATVGEISYALEKVWGRHDASPSLVTGVYANEMEGTDTVPRVQRLASTFAGSRAGGHAFWLRRSGRTATTVGKR